MRFFSYILTITGVLYLILSIQSTIEIKPWEVSNDTYSLATILGQFIGLFLFFYGPTYLLLYFGQRIRKKQKLKKKELTVAQAIPPVQQQVETKTVINNVETRSTPAPKKAAAVSVECRGCGARKAVESGESSTCEYCGSPLTARG
ncbi:hypothetical protein [Paenibacillus paeoniae]|uniref:Uncharacterized protein n=1 Tax=Paenibacillus paeoniae TaxID=2292705 RepID=A0A371P7U9_9BACL|nr:hypothetical protein [Paenibacillus paeoniae]REK71536.1 hypothetical protein DX130_21285 [Paenibacillus paeoniae]